MINLTILLVPSKVFAGDAKLINKPLETLPLLHAPLREPSRGVVVRSSPAPAEARVLYITSPVGDAECGHPAALPLPREAPGRRFVPQQPLGIFGTAMKKKKKIKNERKHSVWSQKARPQFLVVARRWGTQHPPERKKGRGGGNKISMPGFMSASGERSREGGLKLVRALLCVR